MQTKIGFWGTKDTYGAFSNWYKCNFIKDNIKFISAEQALMYTKAITFNDIEIASKILGTTNQREIKALGRKVRNYDSIIWDNLRYQIMVDILKCKFSQNMNLKQLLLSTDNAIILEASPKDSIWGIGTTDLENPKGTNLLGQALMETRKYLMYN